MVLLRHRIQVGLTRKAVFHAWEIHIGIRYSRFWDHVVGKLLQLRVERVVMLGRDDLCRHPNVPQFAFLYPCGVCNADAIYQRPLMVAFVGATIVLGTKIKTCPPTKAVTHNADLGVLLPEFLCTGIELRPPDMLCVAGLESKKIKFEQFIVLLRWHLSTVSNDARDISQEMLLLIG